MASGKLAVYKCISKGLKSLYLGNYMAMTLAKLRIQEIFEGASNPAAFPESLADLQNANYRQLSEHYYKTLRMIELDKNFNLDAHSQDEEITHEKFMDDLQDMAEEER